MSASQAERRGFESRLPLHGITGATMIRGPLLSGSSFLSAGIRQMTDGPLSQDGHTSLPHAPLACRTRLRSAALLPIFAQSCTPGHYPLAGNVLIGLSGSVSALPAVHMVVTGRISNQLASGPDKSQGSGGRRGKGFDTRGGKRLSFISHAAWCRIVLRAAGEFLMTGVSPDHGSR